MSVVAMYRVVINLHVKKLFRFWPDPLMIRFPFSELYVNFFYPLTSPLHPSWRFPTSEM